MSASRPDALQSAWGWDILDGKELGSAGAVMAKVVPKDPKTVVCSLFVFDPFSLAG